MQFFSKWFMKIKCRMLSILVLSMQQNIINSFHVTGLFLYPLKTFGNLWFSDVFRGYRKRLVARNRLMKHATFQRTRKFSDTAEGSIYLSDFYKKLFKWIMAIRSFSVSSLLKFV